MEKQPINRKEIDTRITENWTPGRGEGGYTCDRNFFIVFRPVFRIRLISLSNLTTFFAPSSSSFSTITTALVAQISSRSDINTVNNENNFSLNHPCSAFVNVELTKNPCRQKNSKAWVIVCVCRVVWRRSTRIWSAYHFFSPSADVGERILVVRKVVTWRWCVDGIRGYKSSIVLDLVRRSNLGE